MVMVVPPAPVATNKHDKYTKRSLYYNRYDPRLLAYSGRIISSARITCGYGLGPLNNPQNKRDDLL